MPRPSSSCCPTATTLRLVPLALLLALFQAAGARGAVEETPGARPPNLLVIIADDVGTDRVGIYGEDQGLVRTPNIDRLGRKGLVFENFWAMPLCSPTRAALLSGQYPHRTGIGTVVVPRDKQRGLATDVETLPRALQAAGYTSAILGKWHLGTVAQGYDHPQRMGFAHHRGSFGNLAHWSGKGTYSQWIKVTDGVIAGCLVYATTDTVNDAIELAGELPEPWLLVVSFNAAHRPLHVPPTDLHSYGFLENMREQGPTDFRAMVEAMDTEIGRLLHAVLPQRPVVFFLGDNGTEAGSLQKNDPRRARSKGTLFEGGVRVPLIVNHRSIVAPGRRVTGLANVTDFFATLVELAGIERPESTLPPDTVSLAPYLRSARNRGPRAWMLSEQFAPNGPGPYARLARAVRDHRYKLIRLHDGTETFFDLTVDPEEQAPLPTAELEGQPLKAYRQLAALIEAPPPIRGGAIHPAPGSP